MGNPDYSGGTFGDEPPPKRGGSRLRDVPSFDSMEQAAPNSDAKRALAVEVVAAPAPALRLWHQRSGWGTS
jgi:hypothetical protein